MLLTMMTFDSLSLKFPESRSVSVSSAGNPVLFLTSVTMSWRKRKGGFFKSGSVSLGCKDRKR
jgi:hypothetical protein